MKKTILLFPVVIALCSCPLLTTQVQPPTPTDIDAIDTAAFQTAFAMVSSNMTMTASVPTVTFTPTYPSTPFPTSTPSLTPFPYSAEIESLLQGKCEKPWQSVTSKFRIASHVLEKYEGRGCRYPVFSPGKKYLAYVTLDQQENQNVYVDTVRVIQTATGKVQDAHFTSDMNFMDFVNSLEWTPAGQLIIWESIWEGPWFILVYDPGRDSILTAMRLNREGKLEWNRTGTAFYAEHSSRYGAGTCIHELRGYDFIHDHPFPDFYEIFKIEKMESDPLGIPNGKTDDLAIEPFGWNTDGSKLWITITPLRQLASRDYELGPKQAGVLELAEGKVAFTRLASDPNLDYSFQGAPVPNIISSPYQPRRCP